MKNHKIFHIFDVFHDIWAIYYAAEIMKNSRKSSIFSVFWILFHAKSIKIIDFDDIWAYLKENNLWKIIKYFIFLMFFMIFGFNINQSNRMIWWCETSTLSSRQASCLRAPWARVWREAKLPWKRPALLACDRPRANWKAAKLLEQACEKASSKAS